MQNAISRTGLSRAAHAAKRTASNRTKRKHNFFLSTLRIKNHLTTEPHPALVQLKNERQTEGKKKRLEEAKAHRAKI